jgi:hypothetical protein
MPDIAFAAPVLELIAEFLANPSPTGDGISGQLLQIFDVLRLPIPLPY